MFSNILLAYDGSEQSHKAVQVAAEMARQQAQPGLWLVTVVDPISAELGEPNFSQLVEARKLAALNLINDALQVIGAGVETKQEILFGSVAETIINVAETRQCDLIVMGSRGPSPLAALLLGSQTQKVVNMARCPVLVVK